MIKQLLKWFFSRLYRVEVLGLEHYEKAGKRVLIVANHLSFLDALLLTLYLPQQPLFAISNRCLNAGLSSLFCGW